MSAITAPSSGSLRRHHSTRKLPATSSCGHATRARRAPLHGKAAFAPQYEPASKRIFGPLRSTSTVGRRRHRDTVARLMRSVVLTGFSARDASRAMPRRGDIIDRETRPITRHEFINGA